jgi:hypothetical protein
LAWSDGAIADAAQSVDPEEQRLKANTLRDYRTQLERYATTKFDTNVDPAFVEEAKKFKAQHK